MHQAQLVRVGDHKLAAPKRVIHPRAAKTLDVHAQLHLRSRDFFQLGFGHGFRTSGERRADIVISINWVATRRMTSGWISSSPSYLNENNNRLE